MFNPQWWTMIVLMITVLGVSGAFTVVEAFWCVVVLIVIGFAVFRNQLVSLMQLGLSMMLLIVATGDIGLFAGMIVASVI